MSTDTIRIELRLDVQPNNLVPVPGCEPTSDVTSRTLQQRQHCQCVYVHLNDVLRAIPGARVEYGHNWSQSGWRKKWLVLPGRELICCQPYADWYALLRTLCTHDEPLYEKYEACDVIGQGFCPSPGFNQTPTPPADPYQPQGATPYGQSVTLGTWVPAWQETDATTPRHGSTVPDDLPGEIERERYMS